VTAVVRTLSDEPGEGYLIVWWNGSYHTVPVRIEMVNIGERRWFWRVFAHGVHLERELGEDVACSEQAALARALARVARTYELESTRGMREWVAQRARKRERGIALRRMRRLQPHEGQASLPAVE
jgi:hypothetical protein